MDATIIPTLFPALFCYSHGGCFYTLSLLLQNFVVIGVLIVIMQLSLVKAYMKAYLSVGATSC